MAILFSIIGIVVLQILAMYSRPGIIDLDQIGDHVGETVKVEGVVAQYYRTGNDETVLKIAGNAAMVTVVIETGDSSFSPGDKLEVTGKVVKISRDYQIQVARASLVKKIGSIVDDLKPLESIGTCSGEYVQTRGVVSDLEYWETFVKASVFDPFSRSEAKWYIYDREADLSIGAEVNFSTYVDTSQTDVILRTYMSEAIAVEGLWESKELGIRRAFESLSANRREFMYFPVNITGFVLYQPNPIFNRITLSDRTETGGRTLKINFLEEENLSAIDRGDLVKVRGRLVEDEKTMGLEMEAVFLEVLEPSSPENVSIEAIMEYPYLYRDARVIMTGIISKSGEERISTGEYNITQSAYYFTDESKVPVLSLVVREGEYELITELEQRFSSWGEEYMEVSVPGVLKYWESLMGYVFEASSICP